uniref:C2H2-type domain-containing protein n=1 Tax=Caenorhabditis tropicalis TaxID=1561998 RepID=A0A1I7UYA4_9PELO
MSHINLYSLPTDMKNMIRCRFCEKMYKIDNGSSGFIRHLRCKHPELLFKMGGVDQSEAPGKDQKTAFNNLFSSKNETLFTENYIDSHNVKEEGEDDEMIVMKDVSSNQILANFVSQMDFSQNNVHRFPEKRSRISPTPISNQVALSNEDRTDEPEIKIFNGGEKLQNFLKDIDYKVFLQKKDTFEMNETGEAGSSVTALDVLNSRKGSTDTSPNGSLLDGAETVDSPIQIARIPLNPFGCVICPCSFARIKDLTIHVGSVHRTFFRCNSCQAEFVQPQHLEYHYAMCHVSEAVHNSQ